MRLTVKSARDEDVYKDIARINKNDRGALPSGRIYMLSVNGRAKYFIVRGVSNEQPGTILLDDISREVLNVRLGQAYDFLIERAGPIGQVRWACAVADPAGRIAAVLGVWSMVLSVVGVVLGIWAVWPR